MSSESVEPVKELSYLEELVSYYSSLSDLSKVSELPVQIRGVNSFRDYVGYFAKWHPNLQGLLTSTLTATGPYYFGHRYDLEKMVNIFLWSLYVEGLGFSLLRDYGWDKMERIKPKTNNLFEKVKLALINNPKLVGIGTQLSWLAFLNDNDPTLKYNPFLLFAFTFPAYAAGTLSAQFARNNELLKRGFNMYREDNPLEPNFLRDIYNWVFEHPGLTAGMAGIGSFAYLWNDYASTWGIADANVALLVAVTGLKALGITTLTYLGTSALSWFLHTNSLSIIKHNSLSALNYFLGDNAQAIKHQKHIMQIPTSIENEITNHIRLGKLYQKVGRTGGALFEFGEAAQISEGRREYTNVYDMISTNLSKINPLKFWNYFKYKLYYGALGKDNFKSLLHYLGERDYGVVDLNLRILLAEDPGNIEYHLLYAKLNQGLGLDKRVEFEFRTITQLVLEQPENFSVIGESRNEVMTYAASEFLDRNIIFKRGKNQEQLQEEYEATAYFREKLGDRVASPLVFMEHEDLFYFLSEHSGNETLYSLAIKGELTSDLVRSSLESLALIQIEGENAMDVLGITNPIDESIYVNRFGEELSNQNEDESIYFTHRIEDVFFGQLEDFYEFDDNDLKSRFLSGFGSLNEILVQADRTLYKDSNLRNWVVNRFGDLGAIDFEGLRLMPSQLELVNILEFVNCFSDNEIEEYLRDYVQFTEDQTGREFDFDDFYMVYRTAAVQRHLELIGYRARDFSKSTDMQNQREQVYHFNRAQAHLDYLREQGLIAEDTVHLESLIEDLEIIKSTTVKDTEPTKQQNTITKAAEERNWRPLITAGVSMIGLAGVVLASIMGYSYFTKQDVVEVSPQVFVDVDNAENNVGFIEEKNDRQILRIMEDFQLTHQIENVIGDFSWSPDRRQIVFQQGQDQWFVLDVKSGEQTKIIDYEGFTRPKWSPDGKKIAFHLDPDEFNSLVLIYSFDMHDVMLPPAGYDFFNYNPVWSLDSKQLAFLSQDLDIWGEPVAFLGKINLDGSKFETRPDWRLHDNAIAWSPDGKGIVFSSDKDGDNDLYLTDGNLTSAHKIFITTADEDYEFFYISDDQIVLRSNLKINNPEGDYEIFLVEPEQSFIDNLTRN